MSFSPLTSTCPHLLISTFSSTPKTLQLMLRSAVRVGKQTTALRSERKVPCGNVNWTLQIIWVGIRQGLPTWLSLRTGKTLEYQLGNTRVAKPTSVFMKDEKGSG